MLVREPSSVAPCVGSVGSRLRALRGRSEIRGVRSRIHTCFTVLTAILLNGLPLAGNAASFDCTKAATRVERTICADAQLSELDSRMGRAYGELRSVLGDPERDELLTEQREFLGDRATCEDSECIQLLTADRVTTLEEQLKDLTTPEEGAYESEPGDSGPAVDASQPVADEPKSEEVIPAPARTAPADTGPVTEPAVAATPASEPAPSGASQLPLMALAFVLLVATVAVVIVLRRRAAASRAVEAEPEPTAPVASVAAEPTVAAVKPFCTQCGTRLAPDVKFCTSCGAKRA